MKERYTLSHMQRNYRVKHSGKLLHLLLQKKYSEGREKGGVEFSQGLSMQVLACMHFCIWLYLYISLGHPLLTYKASFVSQFTRQFEFLFLQTTKARVVTS